MANEQAMSEGVMDLEKDMNPRRTGIAASVQLPEPTAWPVVLAFGLALVFSGLLTSGSVSALGAILTAAGCVGWFLQVLPHEQHETVPVVTEVEPIVTERRGGGRSENAPGMGRAGLALGDFPPAAGGRGGGGGGGG